MITIIIPAHNEAPYLNRTIDNIYKTCYVHPEVIVVDQGGNQEIDKRAKVIRPSGNLANVGERVAMNLAAKAASNEFLFRIDAHCDFSPDGWNTMLVEATGEKDITVAVLTALRIPWEYAPQKDKDAWALKHKREDWHDWERLKGHWYGLCRLLPTEDEQGRIGLECKWQKPNRDHAAYKAIEPNMGLTGCGFMIRKKFYWEIGGADESLPAMGAIGEEFAIKAWAHGGKVQTATGVTVGHVFGTGGYDTSGVKVAQRELWERYKDQYPAIAERFPTFEGLKLVRTDQPGKPAREIDIVRTDVHTTTDNATGKPIRKRIEKYRYVWRELEHSDEKQLTDKQIEDKYAPLGTLISSKVVYIDEDGNEVSEAVSLSPIQARIAATPANPTLVVG